MLGLPKFPRAIFDKSSFTPVLTLKSPQTTKRAGFYGHARIGLKVYLGFRHRLTDITLIDIGVVAIEYLDNLCL